MAVGRKNNLPINICQFTDALSSAHFAGRQKTVSLQYVKISGDYRYYVGINQKFVKYAGNANNVRHDYRTTHWMEAPHSAKDRQPPPKPL
jgi:hypothetical protein